MCIKVLIINGPNLNLLGSRETSLYQTLTLEDIISLARDYKYEKPVKIDHFQSNHEGGIIDRIHCARSNYDLMVLNAGAFTHYSIAIRDALLAAGIPFAEVHITNIFAREEFRHKSVIADLAFCVIAGAGALSYPLAITAGLDWLAKKN